MENRVYVSIPLDALIVSGITSDCAVQISAVDGAILIERCDDDKQTCALYFSQEQNHILLKGLQRKL